MQELGPEKSLTDGDNSNGWLETASCPNSTLKQLSNQFDCKSGQFRFFVTSSLGSIVRKVLMYILSDQVCGIPGDKSANADQFHAPNALNVSERKKVDNDVLSDRRSPRSSPTTPQPHIRLQNYSLGSHPPPKYNFTV